jgi:hypothetical protein
MSTSITWIRKEDQLHFVSNDEKILYAQARYMGHDQWAIIFHGQRPQGVPKEIEGVPYESLQYWALAIAVYHNQETALCISA